MSSRESHSGPPAAELTVVEAIRVPTPLAARGHVESPRPGVVEEDLVVIGWAIGETDDPPEVLVTAQERVRGRGSAGDLRVDVGAAFPERPGAANSGFKVVVPRAELINAEILTVEAVPRNGEPVPFWTFRIEWRSPDGQLDSETPNEQGSEPRRRWWRK